MFRENLKGGDSGFGKNHGKRLGLLKLETPDGRINPPLRAAHHESRIKNTQRRAVSHSQIAAAALATHHESRNMRHGLYVFQPAGAKAMRSMSVTMSKWASLLNTGGTCWRARAAIQTSLDGRGLPERFSSRRMAA